MSLGSRLHVTFEEGLEQAKLSLPRRYTLTHSDVTGELFLTISRDYNREQISGWYTRFMRDEVLAEWHSQGDEFSLHLYCHVSGGLAFGFAGMRESIFRQHMPMVLQALREGDRAIFERNPGLLDAKVVVHFEARQKRFRKVEEWSRIGDF